ncbi:MAG: DEAD/DEAH box helicase, partial [Spirochaetia bacterium]
MTEWSGFQPETARWFERRFGAPTEIQDASRAAIAAGEHVLITAPTGSGKTLAAFLYALDRLLSGAWPTGRLSVLYVSPLKALNTDIRENLTEPLDGLKKEFADAPVVRTATRSGDTPQSERRRMLKQPPDILTTTPESLNLLLSSRGGRSILGDIRMVILDEVHAVAGSKRGVHLMTAVERLTRLSGEFQRIALSATVRPLEVVAKLVGGARAVRVIEASDSKVLDISVHSVDTRAGEEPQSPWIPMVGEFAGIVERNRSSLFFTTNRRDAERIALLLNEHAGRRIAYAHHGSLSREVRGLVEEKMRSGELEAIVATSSLELGIDIGSIDEVIFAKTPFSVTSCLQMAGRAGHQVGATSRAHVYPLFGRDCLNAVVTARAAVERDIEPVAPVRKPLDVLAQVLLSMIAMEPHDLDELFDFIRGVDAYAELTREEFDAVIDLLAGKYRATRMRELEPRVTVDRITGVATARPGVARLLYHSGGTIPDRGYYELRRAENGTRIGELDEEFVWERRIGEAFVLGNQVWRIARITDRDVLVEPADTPQQALPFWRGDPVWRHVQLCERLLAFLEEADALISPATAPARGTADAEARLAAWIG